MTNNTLLTGIGVGTLAVGTSVTVVSSSKGSLFGHISLNNPSDVTYKYKQLPCSNKLFKEVDWTKPSSGSDVKTTINGLKLTSSGAQGCISVWWEGSTYKDNDLWGSWNILWGMRDNNHGTIFVSTLTSKGKQGTINGSMYVLKKESNKDLWKVIVEDKASKIETNSLGSESIVLPGNTLYQPKDGWCFLKDYGSQTECANNKGYAKISWNYVTGKLESLGSQSEQTADAWAENLDQWISETGKFSTSFKEIYKEVKGYFSPE